ncbi:two-partner secretion domain-containing protein [Solimonas fluminis]|nr:filamentous hemagglutinin N-terminal domain-containing protein [Solimonas fluminis]
MTEKRPGFRRQLIARLAAAAGFAPGLALATPSGGVVTAGAASIGSPLPGTLHIDQTSSAAIINWQDFSIAQGEFVQFSQPSASAAVLNRVVGGLPSEILGNLSANGRVFIINPQGVMFGAGARVDTASLVATTLDIADQDFLSGRLVFAGSAGSQARVVNHGHIEAADGGFVVLAAAGVSNEGLVSAQLGEVALVSGTAMTLSLDGSGLVGFSIDRAALGAAAGADNGGEITANGGRVLMSAQLAQGLVGMAVNNRGRITAQSIEEHDGAVFLRAEGGDIAHAGVIDASGVDGQDGGQVRMDSDADIRILDGSRILTIGGGPDAAGGRVGALAQGVLRFERGAGIDARGDRRGGEAGLSGYQDLYVHGDIRVGAGGRVRLDPAANPLVIGNGSANGGCDANICEDDLESRLAVGESYIVASADGVRVEDLSDLDADGNIVDGVLDGRSTVAGVLGGSLLLGAGTINSDNGLFDRGSDGSVSFANTANRVRLDGGFEAYSGTDSGSITTGAVEAGYFIVMQAAQGISTGDLAVRGNLALTAEDGGLNSIVAAAIALDGGSGPITVNGGIRAEGTVAGFDGADDFAVRGARVDLFSDGGDITVTGLIDLDGHVGAVNGTSDWSAIGAQLRVEAAGGSVDLRGPVEVEGSLESAGADGGATARVFGRGAEVAIGQFDGGDLPPTLQVKLGGPVTVKGTVGRFGAESESEAIGAFFQVLASGGPGQGDDLSAAHLLGPVDIQGSVGPVTGHTALKVRGGYAEMVVSGGLLDLDAALTVRGRATGADVSSDVEVNGAALFLQQNDGDIDLAGPVTVDGDIGIDEDGLESGQVVASFYTETRAADAVITASGGSIGTAGLDISGDTSRVVSGGDSNSNGVFLKLEAPDGDLTVNGDIVATGTLLSASAPDSLSASAAQVLLTGGSVYTDEAGTRYLLAAGNVDVGGDIRLRGTTGTVTTSGPATVSGSSLGINAYGGRFRLQAAPADPGSLAAAATGSIDLTGGLGATAGAAQLTAEASNVAINATTVSIDGSVILAGTASGIVTGDNSVISGSLLSIQADDTLGVGGDVDVSGTLGPVNEDAPAEQAAANGLFVRAASAVLNADGEWVDSGDGDATLRLQGQLRLAGTTQETVVVGSDSFVNGAYAGIFAAYGNIALDGGVDATGRMDTTLGGDYLAAQAAELRVVAQDLSVGDDIRLTGQNRVVEGGYQSFASASFLRLSALGGDIAVDGELAATGNAEAGAEPSRIVVGGESYVQAVSLNADADYGSIRVTGPIRAEGHLGYSEAAYSSFINGAFLDIRSGGLFSAGTEASVDDGIEVRGTLGSVKGGFDTSAEAADVLVDAAAIDIAGDIVLEGGTGMVEAGHASAISGSYLALTSSYDQQIRGGLDVRGSIDSVAGLEDGDGGILPPDHLYARAVSVSARSYLDGSLGIDGPVVLDGSVDSVEAGMDAFVNGVYLNLGGTDDSGAGFLNRIRIGGDVRAMGSLGTVSAGDRLFARATEIGLTAVDGSYSEDGAALVLEGALVLGGDATGRIEGGFQSFVNGISVLMGAAWGDMLLGTGITPDSSILVDGVPLQGTSIYAAGRLQEVQVYGGSFVQATEFDLSTSSFGHVDVTGDTRLLGSIGAITSAESDLLTVNAVSARFNTELGDILLHGNLGASGTLNGVGAGSSLFARGIELGVFAGNGKLEIDGDLDVAGSSNGEVTGFNDLYVNGAYVQLITVDDDVIIDGDVRLFGSVARVQGEDYVFASGAELQGLPDGAFVIGGGLDVEGSVSSYEARDSSGLFGGEVFIFSGSTDQEGRTEIDGPVSVTGTLGTVTGGQDLYGYGAFASFKSLQGDVRLLGPVTVTGEIARITAGDNLTLSGSGFWADADDGSVQLAGPLQVSGTVGFVDGAHGAFLNGSFAYLTATEGDLEISGGAEPEGPVPLAEAPRVSVTGSLVEVLGDSGIAASGADLLLERSGSEPGGLLSIAGDIVETGSVGLFDVADLESSSRFSGGLLLNANDGGVAFRNITADHGFIYFNQDSAIGEATLTGREYLEIVTPSGAPTLDAQRLRLEAPELFVSANLEAGLLELSAGEALAVSAATLGGGQVHLSSGGLLQLADDRETTGAATVIRGDRLRLEGARIISDEGTLIDAGGLDVVAGETIRLAGLVRVGDGQAQYSGDPALLEQIGAGLPGVLPASARPNAYFQAPTVALAELELAGDYLHIEANTLRLGSLTLNDGTLVQLDPLVNLPFFTESVDVTDAGLDSVKDRLATEDNRVIPNLGSFNSDEGETGDRKLGDRPVLNDGRTDAAGNPQFQVGDGVPNLGQLILQSGLADNTVVIGASDYTAGIQVADQLVVDVLPSSTNFVFATSAKMLITEPIRTNGRVLVLGGGVETDRNTFYSAVVDQINAYYDALDPDPAEEDDGEVEEKSTDGQECN